VPHLVASANRRTPVVKRGKMSRHEEHGTRGSEGGNVFNSLVVFLHQSSRGRGTDDDCEAIGL
jgi:hypothetical protein